VNVINERPNIISVVVRDGQICETRREEVKEKEKKKQNRRDETEREL
jgi:hypothetical protein